MGMDVYGRDPSSEEGDYFRANVWFWRPLWEWTCATCEVDSATTESLHFNDCQGPEDQDTCTKWADALEAAIESGSALRLQQEYELVAEAERLDPSHPCPRCRESGKDPEKDAPCATCKGKGKVENINSWYGFDVGLAQEWVRFLRACGGFRVC